MSEFTNIAAPSAPPGQDQGQGQGQIQGQSSPCYGWSSNTNTTTTNRGPVANPQLPQQPGPVHWQQQQPQFPPQQPIYGGGYPQPQQPSMGQGQYQGHGQGQMGYPIPQQPQSQPFPAFQPFQGPLDRPLFDMLTKENWIKIGCVVLVGVVIIAGVAVTILTNLFRRSGAMMGGGGMGYGMGGGQMDLNVMNPFCHWTPCESWPKCGVGYRELDKSKPRCNRGLKESSFCCMNNNLPPFYWTDCNRFTPRCGDGYRKDLSTREGCGGFDEMAYCVRN